MDQHRNRLLDQVRDAIRPRRLPITFFPADFTPLALWVWPAPTVSAPPFACPYCLAQRAGGEPARYGRERPAIWSVLRAVFNKQMNEERWCPEHIQGKEQTDYET